MAPEYQGRVLTSTVGGDAAPSFGWLGRAAISSHARQPHMNVFGGEESLLAGTGGRPVRALQEGQRIQSRALVDPGGLGLGTLGPRQACADGRAVPEAVIPPQLLGHAVRDRSQPDGAAARPPGDREGAGIAPAEAIQAVAFESANAVTNDEPGPMAAGSGPGVGLDPGHVQAVAGNDGRRAVRPGAGNEAWDPIVERRLIRQGAGGAADRGSVGDSSFAATGRSAARSACPRPRPAGARQLRCERARAHASAVHASGERDGYVNSMWEASRSRTVATWSTATTTGRPPRALSRSARSTSSRPPRRRSASRRAAEHVHVHRTIHLAGPEADLDAVARAVLKVSLAEIAGAFKAPSR